MRPSTLGFGSRRLSVEAERVHPSVHRKRAIVVFWENKLAVLGAFIIALFAAMVLIHPLLMNTLWADEQAVYHPLTGFDAPVVEMTVVAEVTNPATEISRSQAFFNGIRDAEFGDVIEVRQQPAPPSSRHWLGTDPFGRDVFSMLLAGAWPTFLVGLSAAVVSAVLGIVMSAASAVFAGRTDHVLSRFSDVLLLLPAPLAMIIFGAGGASGTGELGPLQFGALFGVLAGASTSAIVLRSHALATMKRPFMDAARVSGARGWYLGSRHLVPHLIPLAAVTMVTSVVGAVVAHGFASWLAYSDSLTNWGAMMFTSISFSDIAGEFSWNTLIAGAVAISVFCAGFYLVSLGLKDVAFHGSGLHHRGARAVKQAPYHPEG